MRAKKRGGKGGAARQGGALAHFPRPAARCRPSQTWHCRRVVRLGANTLPGLRAKCPKRRVRRRTGPRLLRARLPRPTAPPGQRDRRQGRGGALAHFPRPAARCQPSPTRHCRRVVRLGANTLPGLRAKCPKRRVRRRTGPRLLRARLPRPTAPPGQREGQLCEKAPPRFGVPPKQKRAAPKGRPPCALFSFSPRPGCAWS